MEDKKKDLTSFLKDMNKAFGDNAVIRVGDSIVPTVKWNSTGIFSFDLALGGGKFIGGMAEGRIIELYGRESSGKTLISLLTVAEAQKKGKKCAFVDVEQALDFEFAKFLGVDMDDLVVSQPDYGEQALEILDRMISSELFGVIVFDSVAAIVPKAELEGEMGDQKMGVVARLMSQAMRKLTAKANKTGTTVIFINQVRDKIGIVYGNPEVTTGGKALAFFASQRIEVSKGTAIKEGTDIIGYPIKIKVVKNKVAPPYKMAEVENIFNIGIDKIKDILELAVGNEIVQRSGSWYSYEDVKLGQGIDKVRELVNDNPEMLEEITEKLIKVLQK